MRNNNRETKISPIIISNLNPKYFKGMNDNIDPSKLAPPIKLVPTAGVNRATFDLLSSARIVFE